MSERSLTRTAEQMEAAPASDSGLPRAVQHHGSNESLAVLKESARGKSAAGLSSLDLVDSRSETNSKISVDVKEGDTLSGIVAKHVQWQDGETAKHYINRLYSEVGSVAKQNGIANPGMIYVGQRIDIDLDKGNGTRGQERLTPPNHGGDATVPPCGETEEQPLPQQGADSDRMPLRLEKTKIEESEAPLTAAEFAQSGIAVLKKIHPDGSPATKAELAKALEDPSITGKEAQALASMYKNFDGLYSLNGDDGLLNSKSLSAGDLSKYPEVPKAQTEKLQEIYTTRSWADYNFSKYAGADGILKESEIEKALADSETPPEYKEQLLKLKKLMPDIGHGWLFGEKGMTRDDFDKEVKRVHAEAPEAKLVKSVEFILSGAYESQLSTKGVTLYRTENPLDSIKPEAVRQGEGVVGNCYFVASLAGVASSNPEIIRDSIRDNKNGTYTVTFPGAKDEPITVKAPTEAEMSLYNRGGTHGTWASIMEKAYGTYRNNHAWIDSYTPQDATDGGGDPDKVLELLTGKSTITFDPRKIPQRELASQLERAFSGPNPQAATAASSAEWKGLFGGGWQYEGTTNNGFIRRHAFTITGFKPDRKGGGMLQIRDPRDGPDGPDGKIEIPLEMLPKNFWSVSITDKKQN
jgi:hypothetical protein